MDTDVITLTGLKVHGRRCVFAQERETGQDFIVDFALAVPTAPAAATDDLRRTVDYGPLADALADIVAGEPCNLIETLAARLAAECLRDERVQRATVTVHKPQAPIAQQFADVAVTIERDRDSLGDPA